MTKYFLIIAKESNKIAYGIVQKLRIRDGHLPEMMQSTTWNKMKAFSKWYDLYHDVKTLKKYFKDHPGFYLKEIKEEEFILECL